MEGNSLRKQLPSGLNDSESVKTAHLIVVDDDLGMRSLLSDVFTSLGHDVRVFSDAVEALNFLSDPAARADAVITDLNMPIMNGLSFLEALQKARPAVPVILITAFGTGKTAKEASAKGAFGYLSKPFRLSDISDIIKRALRPMFYSPQ